MELHLVLGTVAALSNQTLHDQLGGPVSTLALGGCGLNPRPGHTKDGVYHGPFCRILQHAYFKRSVWEGAPQLIFIPSLC